MADDDAGLGDELTNLCGDVVDRFDAIMNEVDLAAAFQLHLDGGTHQLLVELGDDGLDGHAIFGRSLDHAHVAQADQRHMQCTRDGSGGHRQHIDVGSHLLQPLFVTDTKALFFVDDQQAKVLELQVLREDAMRSDEDIDFAVGHTLEDHLLLLRGTEPGDHLDVDGEVGETALEGFEVLEAEDRCGREDSDLLPILHCLERGAHGDLGFAVTNVSAEQAIHRLRGLHIGLDVGDGIELVVCLVEVEGVFKLALHVGIGREGSSLSGLALRVELQQLRGHVGHRLLDPRLGLLPTLRTQPVELRRRTGFGGTILLDQVEPRERDVEFGFFGELENHQLERRLIVLFDDTEAHVTGDSMLDVDDIVTNFEIAEVGDKGRGFGTSTTCRTLGYISFVGEVLRPKKTTCLAVVRSRSRICTPVAMGVFTMTGVRRSPAR